MQLRLLEPMSTLMQTDIHYICCLQSSMWAYSLVCFSKKGERSLDSTEYLLWDLRKCGVQGTLCFKYRVTSTGCGEYWSSPFIPCWKKQICMDCLWQLQTLKHMWRANPECGVLNGTTWCKFHTMMTLYFFEILNACSCHQKCNFFLKRDFKFCEEFGISYGLDDIKAQMRWLRPGNASMVQHRVRNHA